jgi:hypothetical protein
MAGRWFEWRFVTSEQHVEEVIKLVIDCGGTFTMRECTEETDPEELLDESLIDDHAEEADPDELPDENWVHDDQEQPDDGDEVWND